MMKSSWDVHYIYRHVLTNGFKVSGASPIFSSELGSIVYPVTLWFDSRDDDFMFLNHKFFASGKSQIPDGGHSFWFPRDSGENDAYL